MCYLLLSFIKKTILNFLSKSLIRKDGKIRIWGWRSIRFENTIGLHIFSAIWAIFWSAVHSAIAYINFYLNVKSDSASPSKRDVSNIKNNGYGVGLFTKRHDGNSHSPSTTGKGLNSDSFDGLDTGQDMLVTGFIGLGLLFLMFLTSLPIVRKRLYRFFYYTHHLFLVVVVVLSIHVGGFSIWLATMILYAIDRSVRLFYYSKTPNPKTVVVKRWSKRICELQIPAELLNLSSPQFSGKFIHIQIPKISSLEWHPFDVSSTINDNYIAVYIANTGKWTNSLFELLFGSQTPKETNSPSPSNFSQENTDIVINNYVDTSLEIGFNTQNQSTENSESHSKSNTGSLSVPIKISYLYDSNMKNILENDTVLLVAGGTGISPMISIIKQVIRQSDTRNNSEKPVHKVSDIILVWTCSEPEAFDLLEETLEEISSCEMSRNISIELYSTNSLVLLKKLEKNPSLHQTAGTESENNEFTRNQKQSNFEKYSNFVKITVGRPNTKEIIKRIASQYGSNKRIGVTAAGPDSLVESAYRDVNYINRVSTRNSSESAGNQKIVLKSEINFYSGENWLK
ncbi:hypothetical protein BB559_006764 [Furculomyces boomerangus]|uniref:FAD-binding FR-type domain-containing protein n=1 Tax=Furculomyces boomerangus TaxID=61424 RepID=A0A2T9Y0P3_9FUNG|nr:hypothetical protein BB559_006764 [Furculomyces boomerangus]